MAKKHNTRQHTELCNLLSLLLLCVVACWMPEIRKILQRCVMPLGELGV
jgi:hypothetical protein